MLTVSAGAILLASCGGPADPVAVPASTPSSTTALSTAASSAPTPSTGSVAESVPSAGGHESTSGAAPTSAASGIPNPDPLPKVTAPGARLEFGKSMVAQVGIGVTGMKDGSTYLRYTVTGIEKGDQKILDDLKDKKNYQGGSVYYVRGSVEVLAVVGKAGSFLAGGGVVGVQSDGKATGGLFSVGVEERDCVGDFLIDDPVVGKKQDTCRIVLAEKGTTVPAAAFIRDDTISSEPSDDPYLKSPVVWLAT